jgi:uncharacterized DUF497 family protein
LQLYDVVWKNVFVEKLLRKHAVTTEEVEEVLFSNPHIRFAKKGHIKDEDLYVAYGQTSSGRYLVIFFIRKRRTAALPISAREMSRAEKKYYNAQKKS